MWVGFRQRLQCKHQHFEKRIKHFQLQTTAGTAGSNACRDTSGVSETGRGHRTGLMVVHNYLLLARITICNATIIPIDATIGKNNEFS